LFNLKTNQMIDINKEAEEYKNSKKWADNMSVNNWIDIIFIAGHNSKATQAKVLQAQIDVLKSIDCNMVGYVTTQIYLKIEKLQQQLKQLENEIS
jgi:hypothetical protein